MMNRVIVTGAAGQLGKDVVIALRQNGFVTLASERTDMDITNIEQCMAVVQHFNPDVIIHCAAYTAVDRAESDIETAYAINSAGTRNIAVAAERVRAKLVYISTDYVFDGLSETAYHEYECPLPLTIYGKTKRAGEILVQTLSSRYFIVRTSWVFGRYGDNFVKTMLRLGQERPKLHIVDDQRGSPTYTVDLAQFLIDLISTEKYGVYHASNSGYCTWFEFASAIFAEASELLNLPFSAELVPIVTQELKRPAPRPRNSVMEHTFTKASGFQELRPWREGLRAFLSEINKPSEKS
ncbi:dTDP-4-dehydrorhamnose reductase [Paenibacillus glufosinatiresistens]|uniref:dTDP-4-dehydrorhamnose reductase n=1 Tax=Paenibacillus glufosinatiresistens TaxID=3070657 RepID=UPI00286E2CF2|nr:dTDP-4-dehydrorhamnose reductase [Paenibacillus sp. YX.27]